MTKLQQLAQITNAVSRRSSSWDRTGGNVDCLTDLAPGDTALLLDTSGPGKVTHIWITVMEYEGHETVFRDMVLRMYWDGRDAPSVEVPLGDFFGLGHGLPPRFYASRKFELTADPIVVGANERAMNCYFPMPFSSFARIELYNNGDRSLKQLYFHVDYELGDQPPGAGYFQAEFRQERELHSQDWENITGADNYVLMEAEGSGHYVGTTFYVDSDAAGWWGEGDDMIFLDGDQLPTINGTGTEDYFLNAWCYHRPFSYARHGCPLLEPRPDGGNYTTMYRFHIDDPIRFTKGIRMTMEHAWGKGSGDQTINCYSSVAYWYLDHPTAARKSLARGAANHGRNRPLSWSYDNPMPEIVKGVDLEPSLRATGVTVDTIAQIGGVWFKYGALSILTPDAPVQLMLPVPQPRRYRVEVLPVYPLIDSAIIAQAGDNAKVSIGKTDVDSVKAGDFVDLGIVEVIDTAVRVTVKGDRTAVIQAFRITAAS